MEPKNLEPEQWKQDYREFIEATRRFYNKKMCIRDRGHGQRTGAETVDCGDSRSGRRGQGQHPFREGTGCGTDCAVLRLSLIHI